VSLSGTTTFAMVTAQVIEHALRDTGRIPLGGGSIEPELYQYALEKLNMLMESLQDEKIFLWAIERATLALVAGTAAYDLADDTIDVLAEDITVLRTEDSGGGFTPVKLIARAEYWRKPDRTESAGMPLQVAVEKNRVEEIDDHDQSGLLTMLVYPVPDNSTDVIHYSRARRLGDATSGSDLDAPGRWMRPLCKLLTADLSPGMGLPVNERQELLASAMRAKETAFRGDTERAPIRFYPRMR
jgi:hypothetical protein